jgi:hypothetical protein
VIAPRIAAVAGALGAVALAGLASVSAAGDVRVRGLLDLAVPERGTGVDENLTTWGDSPFDAYGLHLFVEGELSPTIQVFTQLAFNDASQVRADGAYAVVTPWSTRDLHLLAGKLPWPIGTWAPRAYSNKNPLVGTPLMYQHHTSLVWYAIPPDADGLLAAAGTGQTGVLDYQGGGFTMSPGMAIVDDSWWDFGVVVNGSVRPIEFALGATNGSPGWGDAAVDENDGKSVLGRIGVAPVPGVNVGVSGSWGPYLNSGVDASLPPGKNVGDYHQTLGMADLAVEAGHAEIHSEAFVNVWETPTVGDLRVHGGYVEAKLTLAAGLYAAARGDVMRHSKLTDSSGASLPWDLDRDRLEAGAGYRVNRSATVKGVYQRHVELERPGRPRHSVGLVAAQLSLAF